ncbi:MAG: ATP-binding protein [Butyricicoccus sp.]
MLLQVLINLTVNANRHTENGVIAYRIADEGEWVCLRVSDTGSGIAPDCRISLRRAAAVMEAAVLA